MKIKKKALARIIKEEVRKSLTEASDLSPEQKAFFEPIFQAGAKKLGYKIKKMYSSYDGPTAEIEIYKLFKTSGSSWELADFFKRSEAVAVKKALEDNMLARKIGEKSYQPKITMSTERYYLRIWDLQSAGIKFDEKRAGELRNI